MFYISFAMALLLGFLVDVWLGRAGVKDPIRLIAGIVVAVFVAILTYYSHIAHF